MTFLAKEYFFYLLHRTENNYIMLCDILFFFRKAYCMYTDDAKIHKICVPFGSKIHTALA